MKIPATLVLLGEPIEIETEDRIWKFRKNAFYLATIASGKELWIIPIPKGTKTASSVPARAAEMFRKFAGWTADEAFRFTIRDFVPAHTGFVASIAYRSSKWSGKKTAYIHDFENPIRVQADAEYGPKIVRISGNKLSVKAVGITG